MVPRPPVIWFAFCLTLVLWSPFVLGRTILARTVGWPAYKVFGTHIHTQSVARMLILSKDMTKSPYSLIVFTIQYIWDLCQHILIQRKIPRPGDFFKYCRRLSNDHLLASQVPCLRCYEVRQLHRVPGWRQG